MPGNCAKVPKANVRAAAYSHHGEAKCALSWSQQLEDVQQGQHYQCQITSSPQSDCCAKFKGAKFIRGQPEKYKCSWHQCQHGQGGTRRRTCALCWCAQTATTNTPALPLLPDRETKEPQLPSKTGLKMSCPKDPVKFTQAPLTYSNFLMLSLFP